MHSSYQLDHQHAPWHTFRYIIRSKDGPLYQVRRSGFRKYRQFEAVNNTILYYIGVTTIKSLDNEEILADMHINSRTIDTIIGQFTLTDLNISQQSYTLKLNDHMVAQVTRKERLTGDQLMIEIQEINEQYQAFIFGLLILIDSVLETIQNPILYSHSIHAPIFSLKEISSTSIKTDSLFVYSS